MKILEIVKFDLRRMSSTVLLLSIFPILFLFILVLYFYLMFSGINLSVTSKVELLYLLARMYAFILQFTLSVYSILIGIYLLDDKTMSILISTIDHRQKPYLARMMSTIGVLVILNCGFLLIFVFFSSVFLIMPTIELILKLFVIGVIDILVFSSITFSGYISIKKCNLSSVLASLVPLSVFFILPQFLYSGISVGIIPAIFYSFTLQYHLSTFANFLIPSPLVVPITSGVIVSSTLIILVCILSMYIWGLFLTKKIEHL